MEAKRINVLAITILTFISGACSNLGLLDKLENPGGTGSVSQGQALIAFLSSQSTNADLSSYTTGPFASCGGLTNLARADCACQTMATNAGLPMPMSGKYIAWLSSSSNDMSCRLAGITSPLVSCTPPSGGPTWTNTNGQIIANGYGGIFGGSLMAPLNYTEAKVQASAGALAWTGTGTDGKLTGTAATTTCTDWSLAGSAIGGLADAVNANWTNNSTPPSCSSGTAQIYCFAKP